MTVGERIKTIRKQQSLTLKQLSERIDISVSFLSDIEAGKSKPSLERLVDIARGLNTSVSYLMGEGVTEGEGDSQGSVQNQHLKQRIGEMMNDSAFCELLDMLTGFKEWDERDRIELLNYLKVKNSSRNIGK